MKKHKIYSIKDTFGKNYTVGENDITEIETDGSDLGIPLYWVIHYTDGDMVRVYNAVTEWLKKEVSE